MNSRMDEQHKMYGSSWQMASRLQELWPIDKVTSSLLVVASTRTLQGGEAALVVAGKFVATVLV